MKKRNILILIILLFIVFGGYYYYDNAQGGYLSYERDFSIKNFKDIRTIFIANRPTGERFVLHKEEDGHWTVNGKRANNIIMKGMVAALHSLVIQYKPSRAAYVNVMHNITSHALKIEAYDSHNRLMKTLYLGGTPADSYGTYAMVAGSDEPFVIHRKLEEGDVRAVFDMREDDLRDPFLFPVSIDDIKEVKVDYPLRPAISYHIRSAGKGYELMPLYPNTPNPPGEPNQSIIQDYLYAFKSVECEGFINANPVRDTIPSVVPYAIVEVRTQDTTLKIQTYPWDQELLQIRLKGELSEKANIFHYICLSKENDLTLVQTPLIEKIFRRYQDFFVSSK